MAFTEISRQTGTVVRVSATTATDTKNLSVTPTTGQWVAVALYTNQGIISAFSGVGANSVVTAVTCGSVSMLLLESGVSTSINAPTVYIAPYQTGMSTAINVTWANGVASTTLGIAIIVFTGPLTGATSGYAQFRYSTPGTNGAFDGSGNDGAGFGLTQAGATSGIVSWASSASGIPTSYDTQGEVFICATSATSSFNVNQPRQFGLFGAAVDNSGNLTTLGQATGTVVINNATTVVTSGKGVIYSPSGNFVFTYTGTNTVTNTLTGCTTTAPSTALIPGYCQLMLSNNGTSTITAVLPTTSLTSGTLGGFQTGNSTAYSGASTANGHVQVAITGGATPARLDLMLGSNISGLTSVKAYGNLKISGSNIPVGGGFIYTMVPPTRTMTRTSSASRTMTSFFRRTWSRLASATFNISANALKTVGRKRSASATSNRSARDTRTVNAVRVAKATHVRAANVNKFANLIRVARATHIRAVMVGKFRSVTKQAKATQVVSASITRQVTLTRRANATMNYAISSSKSRTFVRKAVATVIAVGRSIITVSTKTHPGTVTSDFKTASVTGKSQAASVVGDFKTASVSTKAKFLVKD